MNTGRYRSRGVACAIPAVGQLAQLPWFWISVKTVSMAGLVLSPEHGQLCLGPLCSLLVQWHRGGADETFLARRSQ